MTFNAVDTRIYQPRNIIFTRPVNITSSRWILYIYLPCIRETWKFVHPRKVIFPEGNVRGKYDYFEGEQIFISPLCKGNECFIPPDQRFGELSPCLTKVLQFHYRLPNEICWPSLFKKLLFRNISGVIFTNMEYRYMTKAR